ncbi:YqzK family protein [Ectobacillus panaciterrae]|uniref:YqzK family protein n=1 Tax=Ectobacillus panaciterrae TaxID=363872 RepID=UPI0003FFC4CF|nr:YqzK family protein [Ectobacillus panaciterrae]
MRKAMKVMFDVAKVFLMFTGCTILFYFAILWINEEYQNYHRYEKPKGESVEEVSGFVADNWVNRMIFFYENGE